MYKVLVIVGSLRKDSFNKKLAHALDKLNHPKLQFSFAKIDDIPIYNQDLDQNLPAPVVRLKQEVAAADAVLLVTPEYNRSVPGVLKNVIDWGTRPYGTNVWARKPMTMAGTSPGVISTAIAQSHLRSIMISIDAIVLGFPEVYVFYKEGLIDENFKVTDAGLEKYLQGFLDRFSEWVGLNHK